jgi:hypothetical protein
MMMTSFMTDLRLEFGFDAACPEGAPAPGGLKGEERRCQSETGCGGGRFGQNDEGSERHCDRAACPRDAAFGLKIWSKTARSLFLHGFAGFSG